MREKTGAFIGCYALFTKKAVSLFAAAPHDFMSLKFSFFNVNYSTQKYKMLGPSHSNSYILRLEKFPFDSLHVTGKHTMSHFVFFGVMVHRICKLVTLEKKKCSPTSRISFHGKCSVSRHGLEMRKLGSQELFRSSC